MKYIPPLRVTHITKRLVREPGPWAKFKAKMEKEALDTSHIIFSKVLVGSRNNFHQRLDLSGQLSRHVSAVSALLSEKGGSYGV